MNRYALSRRAASDAGLVVTFYTEPVEDQEATAREGRPIYKDADSIRIHVPNDPSCDINTRVNESHARRFPDEYEQFKATQKQPLQGTPLTMWPALSAAAVKELAHFGIVTVEQLAELEPKELRVHTWLVPYHEKASVWLQSIADNGVVLKLEAQVQELTKRLQDATTENAELLSEVLAFRKASNEKKRATKAALIEPDGKEH